MQITINDTPVETREGETILEAARRIGYAIPSLCYDKEAQHKSSCMLCAVKNCANGQVIPSCTTIPTEGMRIETENEEIIKVRTLSLELLLSDHRADCEAPCSMVCPQGLDVEHMLTYYDADRYENAHAVIASAFSLPVIACDTCKAPCEKACRRGTIDKAVSIRQIIREIVERFGNTPQIEEGQTQGVEMGQTSEKDNNTSLSPLGRFSQLEKEKNIFYSRLGRFTQKEKERLKATVNTPSRCLHCACAGRTGCKLRLYATAEGIKRPRYDASSALPAMTRQHVNGNIWFEQAKCVRCGLCVYNSQNGFTFKDRGFGMQVVLPEENRGNVGEEVARLCPTGAIYTIDKYVFTQKTLKTDVE